MLKDTADLIKELGLCEDYASFYEQNETEMTASPLHLLLEELIDTKQLKKSQVILDSELSEVYAYQIFSGIRKPDRKKVLCLCVAMHLSTDEVQSLLKRSGYPPLYVKNPFDSVVIYGICKQLSVIEINDLLFKYDQETLG